MSTLKLFCENEENPMGIDCLRPLFSWMLIQDDIISDSKDIHIQVWLLDHAGKEKERPVWTCRCDPKQPGVRYGGEELLSKRQYIWEGILETEKETLRAEGRFETAFLQGADWKASWIRLPESRREPDYPPLDEQGNPLPAKPEEMRLLPGFRIRKEFVITEQPVWARIYVTAYGLYEIAVDGERIGTCELAPEHTDYNNQLLYQIYAVTEKLTPGRHTLGVRMASGWYMGRVGFSGEDCQYGNELGLLLQMNYMDRKGREHMICSDESFLYEKSEYNYADLFIGEYVDGRRLCPEFYQNGYVSEHLKPARRDSDYTGHLAAQPSMHIQALEEIEPVQIRAEENSFIIDFGTVLAGKVRMDFYGKKDAKIVISHTELLAKDGTFEKNINEPYKDQEDHYICADDRPVIYEPRFTYHGFRYVKIDGLDRQEQIRRITAKAITSRMRQTLSFCCSDERLNQLQRNILRSQRSNSVAIPTDCPQREKGGWTGDVLVFSKTACVNQDMRNFYKRWLRDMQSAQKKTGEIPIIVPYLPGTQRVFEGIFDSAGWSDAAIVLPWNMYQAYGEIQVLEENYDMMKRWFACVERAAYEENPEELQNVDEERREHLRYIRNTGFHFADWLTPSVSMDPVTGGLNMMQSAFATMEIVPTLFYYYMADLMGKIADILHDTENARHYQRLGERIREAFYYEFLDNGGNIKTNLQGICVLALAVGIVKGKEKERAYQKFKALLQENGGQLDTGFLSVPFVLDVICQNGDKALAYQILLSETYPSWLYEVKMGATGLWEAWNAVLPDGTGSHISLNHYAYGCVGDWMYRHILGLESLEPGYRTVRIAPDLDSPLTFAKGRFLSVSGPIGCEWKRDGHKAELQVEIPDGVHGILDLRYMGLGETVIMENSSGAEITSGKETVELTAGKYTIYGMERRRCRNK